MKEEFDALFAEHQKLLGELQAMRAVKPAPVQQEMVDDEGENQAVRMFLALYGGQYGITAEQMRKHLKMAGFDGAWPEWANSHNGHLTKAGAQLWIRHLFALAEQPAQQEYERGFIDGMQAQMKRSVDRAVNAMAQRTWVGLTDDERRVVRNSVGYNQFVTAGEYAEHVQKATEFLLKEKNDL